MTDRGEICAVIGGQMGSEGKGVIVSHLAMEYDTHVRVGAPNAGHSMQNPFYGDPHRIFKMQSVPVGWMNPEATLIIGRGALVNPEILTREIASLNLIGAHLDGRLWVDPMAGVLDPKFHIQEGGVDGEIHQRIGSTGEGVGAARVARLNRDPSNFYFFKDLVQKDEWRHLAPYLGGDTVRLLRQRNDAGSRILLEGAQGVHLSLIHGPWPYVTTTDCGAAQLAADCGLPPRFVDRTVCVIRSHPIRVAGNSGPLKFETTWGNLSVVLGKDVEEHTTVTDKVRRVGEWDSELVDLAVWLNQPTSFALTFADYINPDDEGRTEMHQISGKTCRFIDYLEGRWGIPVSMVGTGGDPWQVIRRTGVV